MSREQSLMDSITGEDRLTNLPDDIVHHILSFLDTKYAIQLCTLSRNWKNMWTLMPRLDINCKTFYSIYHIAKFVAHALNHRNNLIEVSTVNLTFIDKHNHFVVEDIVKYAYLHNVKQMTIEWVSGTVGTLPQWLFSSHTLKHLALYGCKTICVPVLSWDFPLLETLILGSMRLGDGIDKDLNLFSKCVNLKDLTLRNCSMNSLESFSVCAPQLLSLTVSKTTVFPRVFNVVAPRLENITASLVTENDALSSSFNFLRLSTKAFRSLEKVNLFVSNGRYKKEKLAPLLMDLFRIVRNAKYLILDVDIIKCLSSSLDQLSNKPCPFNNLKCLKINMACLKQDDDVPTIPIQVRSYFLENSPNVTLVIDPDSFQVFLVAKKRTQDQLMVKMKRELQIKNEVIENQIKHIQRKDQVIAQQNTDMELLKWNTIHIPSHVPALRPVLIPFSWNVRQTRGCVKRWPTLTEENKKLEEEIQIQVQVIANLRTKLQTADRVITDQTISLQKKEQVIAVQDAEIGKLKSYNMYKQSHVPAPFSMSESSSSIVPHKRSQCLSLWPSWGKKKIMRTKSKECSGTTVQFPVQLIAKQNSDQVIANQIRDQVIANQSGDIQMKDRVIADQKADIKVKDLVIANQYANIQMKDKVIAKLTADIEQLKSNHIHIQSSVPAPPPVPRPSSSNEEEDAYDKMAEDPRANYGAAKTKLIQDDATDDKPVLNATVPPPDELILKRKSDEMAKLAKRVRFDPSGSSSGS